eukprot:m.41241 g.41241  ORF g.41241 m.41241 type:complete len:676 (-) comp6035_c0_seq2:220-2247(-)
MTVPTSSALPPRWHRLRTPTSCASSASSPRTSRCKRSSNTATRAPLSSILRRTAEASMSPTSCGWQRKSPMVLRRLSHSALSTAQSELATSSSQREATSARSGTFLPEAVMPAGLPLSSLTTTHSRAAPTSGHMACCSGSSSRLASCRTRTSRQTRPCRKRSSTVCAWESPRSAPMTRLRSRKSAGATTRRTAPTFSGCVPKWRICARRAKTRQTCYACQSLPALIDTALPRHPLVSACLRCATRQQTAFSPYSLSRIPLLSRFLPAGAAGCSCTYSQHRETFQALVVQLNEIRGHGDEGTIAENGFELLGKRKLVKVARILLAWDRDVDLRALGCDDVCVKAALTEKNQGSVRLVQSDCRCRAKNLDLNALAVDSLEGGNDVLKYNSCLLASADEHRIDLANNLDDAITAVFHLHHLMHIGLGNLNRLVVLHVAHNPTLALTLAHWLIGCARNKRLGKLNLAVLRLGNLARLGRLQLVAGLLKRRVPESHAAHLRGRGAPLETLGVVFGNEFSEFVHQLQKAGRSWCLSLRFSIKRCLAKGCHVVDVRDWIRVPVNPAEGRDGLADNGEALALAWVVLHEILREGRRADQSRPRFWRPTSAQTRIMSMPCDMGPNSWRRILSPGLLVSGTMVKTLRWTPKTRRTRSACSQTAPPAVCAFSRYSRSLVLTSLSYA